MCRICDDQGCNLCDYSYEDAEYNSILEEIKEELNNSQKELEEIKIELRCLIKTSPKDNCDAVYNYVEGLDYQEAYELYISLTKGE